MWRCMDALDVLETIDCGNGPVALVGYAAAWMHEAAKFMPERSLVVIEEPDVIRKRSVRAATAGSALVHSVIECEYHLDGSADAFFHEHRDLRLSAVIPVVDYAVPFAARLAERHGLAGAGYGAARTLRDKRLTRLVTAAAGIPNPASIEVRGPEEVKSFMSDIGGPIVLKPANRQASIGTKIVGDLAEVDQAWIDCAQQDEGVFVPDRPMPVHMLAERFVHGTEYSVEMMIAGGQPVFGAATRKFLFPGPRPVEQGHLHPAGGDPELNQRLVADTARVLAAVGMDTGFAHCEWMVEDGVPYLVECAGRMAGGGIIELVQLAWGYHIVSQFVRVMRGDRMTVPPPQAPPGFAACWFADSRPGRVLEVTGLADARAEPGVNTVIAPEVGEETGPLLSCWDRPVLVTARADTADGALSTARRAAERIVITVGPAEDA